MLSHALCCVVMLSTTIPTLTTESIPADDMNGPPTATGA